MNAIGTAIQEVEQRIQQLQELHASLVKAVPLLTSVPLPESAPTPATQVRMVKTLRKLKRVKVAAAAAPPKKLRALNVRKLGERPGVGTTATGPKVPPAQSTQAVLAGKADTVVGAIKLLLRDETAPFTKEELVENLNEDADYKKLLEAEGGAKALENALYHWTNSDKLKRQGEFYTVTAAGKEWFNK